MVGSGRHERNKVFYQCLKLRNSDIQYPCMMSLVIDAEKLGNLETHAIIDDAKQSKPLGPATRPVSSLHIERVPWGATLDL